MDDQSVAQRQSRSLGKPGFAALAVLAVCFMLSVLGRGLGESFTVFLLPISETFGWNRGQVISVYSLAALATALASPLVGRMFDRFGPRVVYSLALIVLGGAFLVGAYGQQLWQLQLSLGLCVGLGIAGIGIVPNSILLGRWFGPRLPAAMAVVYSAGGAGVLMLLPASQLLIDRIGWRGAYFFESPSRFRLLLEHDVFRKPVSTFRHHALMPIPSIRTIAKDRQGELATTLASQSPDAALCHALSET